MIHALAQSLPDGRALSETEVNTEIRDWLGAGGKAFFVDHVALRRELVDCGFLDRDSAGREYRRSRRYRERQSFESDGPDSGSSL